MPKWVKACRLRYVLSVYLSLNEVKTTDCGGRRYGADGHGWWDREGWRGSARNCYVTIVEKVTYRVRVTPESLPPFLLLCRGAAALAGRGMGNGNTERNATPGDKEYSFNCNYWKDSKRSIANSRENWILS